jgi:carbamoyltransferase
VTTADRRTVLGLLGQPAPLGRGISRFENIAHSGWYHNSAAAITIDGLVVAAIEEERISRIKGIGKFPAAAIAFCLKHAGLRLSEVDLIVFGEQGGQGPLRDPDISVQTVLRVLREEVDPSFDDANRIRLIDHHTAHAWSAFVPSGFDQCLVITADGFGDGVSGGVWIGQNGQLSARKSSIPFESSLGHFYSRALPYFGYRTDDEYKVMGLAAHGNPARFRSALADTFVLKEDGGFSFLIFDRDDWTHFYTALGPGRAPGEDFLPHHADVAAAVQDVFEKVLLHFVGHHRERTRLTQMAAAGGCFQNSVAVGALRRSGLFEQIFVQPAAHDAGISIGACYAARYAPRIASQTSAFVPYLGTSIGSDSDIQATLFNFRELIMCAQPHDLQQVVAQELAAGKVIGWMQGRSEFGPRALGNRSILADPQYDSMRHRINAAVKSRETFRPLAPVVPENKAATYFAVAAGERFPFMTATVEVRPHWRHRLAAVTHRDGSARIQTVTRNQNSRLFHLLEEYERRAGIPILINTSLNGPSEPIADSARDGIDFFLRSGLDGLVVGDLVIGKRPDLDEHLASERYVLSPDWRVEVLESAASTLWVARSAYGDIISFDTEHGRLWRTLATYNEIRSYPDAWPTVETLWKARVLRLRAACLATTGNLTPPQSP